MLPSLKVEYLNSTTFPNQNLKIFTIYSEL